MSHKDNWYNSISWIQKSYWLSLIQKEKLWWQLGTWKISNEGNKRTNVFTGAHDLALVNKPGKKNEHLLMELGCGNKTSGWLVPEKFLNIIDYKIVISKRSSSSQKSI